MRNEQLTPNPPAIVEFAQISNFAELALYAQAQKQFSSTEELLYYITHEIDNKKHKDGRIYMTLNNGQLMAQSVSPFSKNFEFNIEDGVKDLVNTLLKKRYLTYSSCEGHDYTFRRYVGLAFADKESRQKVIDYISGLKIKGIKLREFDIVSNMSLDIKNTNVKYNNKFKPQELDEEAKSKLKNDEIKTFNIQFHREYEDYCFLEIIILDEIDFSFPNFFKKPFYNLWLIYMKKYKWDKITRLLVKKLNHKDFPKYLY